MPTRFTRASSSSGGIAVRRALISFTLAASVQGKGYASEAVAGLAQALFSGTPVEQIVAVFEKVGRSVPVFVDKHLSYDHRKAREMVDTAKRLEFGLMAGSSLPVTWRRPELELPLDTKISEGLVVFGGGIPLVSAGRTIGGIGVSGGSSEQDVRIAEAGAAALD